MKTYRVLLLSALIGMVSTAALADPPSNMQVFTSSGSFTVPSGVTRIEVEVRGGGGGGGSPNGGQGGCGGGYGKQVFTVAAGSVHAVTVGAGGSANGGAGGTSSFGTLISATGGGGGLRSTGGSCAGGTSTAALNMTGFLGEQNGVLGAGASSIPFSLGGACGDGSTRGSGGTGFYSTASGSPGVAGDVVVRW